MSGINQITNASAGGNVTMNGNLVSTGTNVSFSSPFAMCSTCHVENVTVEYDDGVIVGNCSHCGHRVTFNSDVNPFASVKALLAGTIADKTNENLVNVLGHYMVLLKELSLIKERFEESCRMMELIRDVLVDANVVAEVRQKAVVIESGEVMALPAES